MSSRPPTERHIAQRRVCLAILPVVLLIVSSLLTSCVHAADDAGAVIRKAVAAVSSSVVRIRMIGTGGGADLSVSSRVTTGLAISDDGFVLTSAFGFTSKAAAVFVEDAMGDRVAAKVVATDHVRKLVLLRCDGGKFVRARYSQGRWPAVGATGIAVGKMYPGDQASVSVGIVSAVNRIFGLAVQTDAKISPVNYGGPIIDINGDVMGILVPLSPQDSGDDIDAGVEWYDSGIGFAIPMRDALQTADELRKGEDRVRGVVGVGFSTKNPLATDFKIKKVYPGSPAAKAELQEDDTILEANGATIDRFGVFEAIVKSSYAGDTIRLLINRGNQKLKKDLLLADRVPRATPGYFGLLVGEPVEDKDDNIFGVRSRVVLDSPLAKAGLPETVVIRNWDDTKITSVKELIRLTQTAAAGVSVNLKWVTDVASTDVQESVVEPVKRNNTVVAFPKDAIADIAGTTDSVVWKRSEKTVGDDGGKVWFYAPEETSDIPVGIVVMLSEGDASQEAVLNRWKEVCRLHNLILVVPIAGEKKGLSREDMRFIQMAVAIALAAKDGRKVDPARSVLVASAEQAEVCTGLVLQTRRRQFRAAVFVDSWPQISGASSALLAATSPSSLVLTGNIQSRQRMALMQQAVATLRKSNTWVVQQRISGDDEVSTEERIANWILNLKIR